MKQRYVFLIIVSVFGFAWWLPVDSPRVQTALVESFAMLNEYAREHVLFCLIPAFLIAGGITIFVRQATVMKYLGRNANKVVAYCVASVSGSILAVCSCTVLPLFSSIRRRGAGLGPAIAFLYSGPAINVLAIVLTARILGLKLGLARAIGAVGFSVVIGLIMQVIFSKQEKELEVQNPINFHAEPPARKLWHDVVFFAGLVGFLVFANWAKGGGEIWLAVYSMKWPLAIFFSIVTMVALWKFFTRGEVREWLLASWLFAKQLLPLLLAGILIAGFLLGRPEHEGLIPSEWVSSLVGGNSLFANFFASFVGAFMYFATLTEVPIIQGLMGAGMGDGPALALMLAGPALSLPNMLVIRSIMGTARTVVYVSLVIVMATISGMIYGTIG